MAQKGGGHYYIQVLQDSQKVVEEQIKNSSILFCETSNVSQKLWICLRRPPAVLFPKKDPSKQCGRPKQ